MPLFPPFNTAGGSGGIPDDGSVTTPKLANNSVTNPKLADMVAPTFKGRVTAGTGDPEDLTVAQMQAALGVGGGGYVHPNHSGEVSSIGDGAQTIALNAVTNAKLADVPTATLKGRATAALGDPEDLTPAQARSLLNVADGANNFTYTHPNHGGDVTSVGDGAQTIALNVVTNAKLADMPTATIKGKDTAGTGDPKDLTVAEARALLNVVNYAHPNHSGDVVSVADGATTIQPGVVTLAKLASMNTDRLLGRDTAAVGLVEELALDATLEFSGAGTVRRAALTGAITASAGSNVTALADAAVTLPKLAPMNTDRLLGRDTAAVGPVQEIALDATLVLNGSAVLGRAALTGDVTVAAGANAAVIPVGSISPAKLADMSSDRLLGRDTAATGPVEEIGLNATLEFTGSGTLQRAALTGAVTANAGSNSTTIPLNSLDNNQLKNMANQTIKGRVTAGAGSPEDMTVEQLRYLLHYPNSGMNNMIFNPGFDEGTFTGWTQTGTCAIVTDSAGVSGSGYAALDVGANLLQIPFMTVEEGKSMELSAFFKGLAASTAHARMTYFFYTELNATIASGSTGNFTTAITTSWVKFVATALVIPATARKMRVRVEHIAGSTATTLWVDQVSVRRIYP